MALFLYEARDTTGSHSSGRVEATDRRGALDNLLRRGLHPSNLELAPHVESIAPDVRPRAPATDSARTPASPPATRGFRWRPGSGRRDVTAFTREMAALLDAGIPVAQALEGLVRERESEPLRAPLSAILDAVKGGEPLSLALAAHPRLFPKLYASMVRAGEEAGALPKVMAELADLREHEDELRGEVAAAVAYPLFVLVFGLVTAGVLLGFVLPQLLGMLDEMVETLPTPTRILIGLSHAFENNWALILGATAAAAFFVRAWLRSPRGAFLFDRTKLATPILGPLLRTAASSRFAGTLGVLARSGVPILGALEIVRDTIGNRVLAGGVERLAEETRGGGSLAAPLRALGLFPSTLVQMIAVGEETGRLDEMLLKVARIEERHLRTRSRTLVSLLGPVLILAVGGLVGFLVLALLLPIFQMSQAVR